MTSFIKPKHNVARCHYMKTEPHNVLKFNEGRPHGFPRYAGRYYRHQDSLHPSWGKSNYFNDGITKLMEDKLLW